MNQQTKEKNKYLTTWRQPKTQSICWRYANKFSNQTMECMSNRWRRSSHWSHQPLQWELFIKLRSRPRIGKPTRINFVCFDQTDWISRFREINKHSRALSRNNCNQLLESLDLIASNIKERTFSGLQLWERDLFNEHIRPLCDALIGTIFLQKSPKRLNSQEKNLLDALAIVFQDTYFALKISFHLLSIIKSQSDRYFDEEYTELAHKRGDRFTYLLCNYMRQLDHGKVNNDLFYYASAIDFATHSPALHRNITNKLKELLPGHLKDHPRQSKPRHWVERLGTMNSNSAQMLVSKMLQLGFSRSSGLTCIKRWLKLNEI